MKPFGVFVIAMLLTTPSWSQSDVVKTIAVPDVLKQKAEWDSWVDQKKKLRITGRYDGRLSRQFRLAKLPIAFQPSRLSRLPDNIEKGQRLLVTGTLRKSGTRFLIDVEGIYVDSTDSDRIRNRIRKLKKDDAAGRYSLAEEFTSLAEFYDDSDLKAEIRQLQELAFEQTRNLAGNDPQQLLLAADRGAKLGIDSRVLQALRFHAMVSAWQRPGAKAATVIAQIKAFAGWDKKFLLTDEQSDNDFLKAASRQYNSATDAVRSQMHRRLYRLVRKSELIGSLRDASEGLKVASVVEKELPEEIAEIAGLKEQYVKYRMDGIPKLTRRQFEDLDRLLVDLERDPERRPALEQWLKAQDVRLGNEELENIVALSEDYHYAFERWKHPEHKARGDDLLKKAWLASKDSAPKEAQQLYLVLQQNGWEWLHGKWMTTSEVKNLPKNDIELAMREDRVVVGMTSKQVIGVMNSQPDRKMRVISAKRVHEIWIFGGDNSTKIIVHMARSRFGLPDEAVATHVGQSF